MLAYSGRAQLAIKPVRLSEVVRELGQLLEASVSKKAPLDFRLDADLPVIEADPTQLRQVVMNLIINASEAMGDAAGTVTVTTRVADVPGSAPAGTWIGGTPPPGRYVAFEVADAGCGMDAETLSRIFDPFFTTKFTGRGLGLAVVLGIVRGHGGHLAVDTAPGCGTVFAILFPPTAHPEEVGAVDQEAKPAATWTGCGTVLIVDDEPAVRRLARVMVERCGFDTLLAEDGEEALRVFSANRGLVTGVLLDLSMPRMGGRETLRELRRLDPDVPVLLSSGYPEQDPVPGATGFVQKPYRLATLTAALRAALSMPV
jgi:CheY-like chemotaxis protein